jgi:hypothetical protein
MSTRTSKKRNNHHGTTDNGKPIAITKRRKVRSDSGQPKAKKSEEEGDNESSTLGNMDSSPYSTSYMNASNDKHLKLLVS